MIKDRFSFSRFTVLFILLLMTGLTISGADQYKLSINQDGIPFKAKAADRSSKVGADRIEIQREKKAATEQGAESENKAEMETVFETEPYQSINSKAKKTLKYFVGMNIAHSVVVSGVSLLIGNDVLYLPIRFNAHFALSNAFGFSGQLIYRFEKDGSNFKTHEIGFAIGPRFSFSRKGVDGLYATCQIGFGFCSGKDYFSSDYHRIDFIVNPEIGYVIPTKVKGLGITVGVGLQTLIPLTETGRGKYWEWNDLGNLSHYYLPVINLSIGFK